MNMHMQVSQHRVQTSHPSECRSRMLGVDRRLKERVEVSIGQLADGYMRDVDSVSGLRVSEEAGVVVGRFAGQVVVPRSAAMPNHHAAGVLSHMLHLEAVQEVAGGQPLASASADVEAAAGVRTL